MDRNGLSAETEFRELSPCAKGNPRQLSKIILRYGTRAPAPREDDENAP